MLYVLIGISLFLASLTGLQFLYMFYLDRVHNQRKIYVRQLEKQCRHLSERLSEAEAELAGQSELIGAIYKETGESEEVWADVIDER